MGSISNLLVLVIAAVIAAATDASEVSREIQQHTANRQEDQATTVEGYVRRKRLLKVRSVEAATQRLRALEGLDEPDMVDTFDRMLMADNSMSMSMDMSMSY